MKPCSRRYQFHKESFVELVVTQGGKRREAEAGVGNGPEFEVLQLLLQGESPDPYLLPGYLISTSCGYRAKVGKTNT